ncbi:MAG: disulfide bond formation protein B [Acidocella sp.]|nr:disulfide bond formation protein B [Acidocella sp.]
MPPRLAGTLACLFSLAVLGAVYYAQDVMHLAPCPLCLWERWPYRIAAALGLATLAVPRAGRFLLSMAALVMLGGAAIAFVHVGVEHGWWRSPLPECNAFLTPGAPLALIPAIPCDRPVYLIAALPVSMALMDFCTALAFACVLFAYVSSRKGAMR